MEIIYVLKKYFYIHWLWSLSIGFFICGVHQVAAADLSIQSAGSSFSLSDVGEFVPGSIYDSAMYRIGSAGDVDQDGFDDVLVGVPGSNAYAGAVYLQYGESAGLQSANLTTATKFTSSSRGFGTAVASAGDINGDGIDDFMMSASGESAPGEVFIYYGSTQRHTHTSTETANVKITINTNDSAQESFGQALAAGGDINNDGFDDILISFPNAAVGGYVYIVYGQSTLPADFVIESTAFVSGLADGVQRLVGNSDLAITQFGFSITGDANIDSDAQADLIIGAYSGYDNDQRGEVFVLLGKDITQQRSIDITTLTTSRWGGPQLNSGVGRSVSVVGDLNGDNQDDIAIGAPYIGSGKVYLLYSNTILSTVGSNTLLSSADVEINGEAGGRGLGMELSVHGGDVNNDDLSDVVALYTNSSYNTQSGYIIYGTATPRSGSVTLNNFTHALENITELNSNIYGATILRNTSDQYDDVVLYSPYGVSAGSFTVGGQPPASRDSVLMYNGAETILPSTTVPTNASAIMSSEPYTYNIGRALAAAGDMNGDGNADYIIGAPYDFGAAIIWLGRETGDYFEQFKYSGERVGDQFGFSASQGVDINSDNKTDVMISAPYADDGATNAGKVYIFYGQADIKNRNAQSANHVIIGNQANQHFGWGTQFIPDLNGDLLADIIISAPNTNAGDGVVYIFYSSTVLQSNTALTVDDADKIITGQSGENFGAAMTTLADRNNDGLTDLMIGAPAAAAGQAYVFYSDTLQTSVITSAMANRVFIGETAGDQAGFAMADAGDVNNDGVFDYLIGAPYYAAAQGVTYVVYGRTDLPTTVNLADANISLIGESAETTLGVGNGSLAGMTLAAYDADEDGYSDLLVSAPALANAGTDTNAIAGVYYIPGVSLDANVVNTNDVQLADQTMLYRLDESDYTQLGRALLVNDAWTEDTHRAGLWVGAPCTQRPDICRGSAQLIYLYTEYDNDGHSGSDVFGFPEADDCDDHDLNRYPGFLEICDGIDNDCNDLVDDGLPVFEAYPDLDADAYGDSMYDATESCVADGYYVADHTDCRDDEPTINPGAAEQCNARDDNCNNLVDEGVQFFTMYLDNDGDHYGDPARPLLACTIANQYVRDNTDCRDDDPNIHPLAKEIPNDGIDQDCSGADEVTQSTTPNQPTQPDDDNEDTETIPDNQNETSPTKHVRRVLGARNGYIRVFYSDHTMQRFRIFNVVTKRRTEVQRFPQTKFYVVVHPFGRKISFVNPLDGMILTSLPLSNHQRYFQNEIYVKDFLHDQSYEVLVISKRQPTAHSHKVQALPRRNLVSLVRVTLAPQYDMVLLDRLYLTAKLLKPVSTKTRQSFLDLRSRSYVERRNIWINQNYQMRKIRHYQYY